jgi:polysaccharide biosynthesis protein PslF
VEVVRAIDQAGLSAPAEMVHDLVKGSPRSVVIAAEVLNGFDVVVVQHDHDIYGGRDGEELLDLLELVDVPVTVVLHAVLVQPSRYQRLVLTRVIDRADAVVTMSDTAARRLLDGYTVDPDKLLVIPHGAPADGLAMAALARARPTILTWGLLGPDKGIETAISALPGLRDLEPATWSPGRHIPECSRAPAGSTTTRCVLTLLRWAWPIWSSSFRRTWIRTRLAS